jgi:uncharacterized Zn-binding protein involved in type VI secretion
MPSPYPLRAALIAALLALGWLQIAAPVLAQTGESAGAMPGVVTEGSGNTTVGGRAATRAGDRAGDATIVEGSPNVFINGRPAARAGDKTGCGGVVLGGGGNVYINGRPAAAAADLTTGCPPK